MNIESWKQKRCAVGELLSVVYLKSYQCVCFLFPLIEFNPRHYDNLFHPYHIYLSTTNGYTLPHTKPSTISEIFSADSTTSLSLPDVSYTYRTFYYTREFIYSIHCSSYWFEPPSPFIRITLNSHTTFTNTFQSLQSLQHNKPNHHNPLHTKNNTSHSPVVEPFQTLFLSRTLPNTKHSLSLFHKFHNTIHSHFRMSTTLWSSSIPFIVHPIDLNHLPHSFLSL